jgi:DHA1 family multidrug resistance protein-like MFS transporter
MAASLVTNASYSHSLSSETTIAASSSSAVHSPTSTVLGNHGLTAKSEKEYGDARIEIYVEDKLKDPPLKEPGVPVLPFLPQPNTDPNLVTWDGPDDPANPQNWSFWYKSWLTGVCSLMTVAVYVHLNPHARCLV